MEDNVSSAEEFTAAMIERVRKNRDEEEPKRFKFGTCTVPDGKCGKWEVDTFTIPPEAAISLDNLRALRDNPILYVPPGTYRRLSHKDRGVVMSNTRMERLTALEAYLNAKGRVLVNGLGLGMVLEGMLAKPGVEHVTVIEIESDVIKLVGKHFKTNKRVEIIEADAYAWQPPKGVRYNYVWHDVWDDISERNLPSMAKLCRKYGRRADAQGVWSRSEVYRMRRAENQRYW